MPPPMLPYKRPFFQLSLPPQEIQVRQAYLLCAWGLLLCAWGQIYSSASTSVRKRHYARSPSPWWRHLECGAGGPGHHHHTHKACQEERSLPATVQPSQG